MPFHAVPRSLGAHYESVKECPTSTTNKSHRVQTTKQQVATRDQQASRLPQRRKTNPLVPWWGLEGGKKKVREGCERSPLQEE